MNTWKALLVTKIFSMVLLQVMNAQTKYFGPEGEYIITEDHNNYYVRVNTDDPTRHNLQSRCRLKAADLTGYYILFNEYYSQYTHIQGMFQVFTDYSDKQFTANLEAFRSDAQKNSTSGTLFFSCGKDAYNFRSLSVDPHMDLRAFLTPNFLRYKDIGAANLLFEYGHPDMKTSVSVINGYLSGKQYVSEDFNNFLFRFGDTLLTGERLTKSGKEIQVAMKKLENGLVDNNNLLKRLTMMLLFSPTTNKEKAYEKFRATLQPEELLLDRLLLFAKKKTASTRNDQYSLLGMIQKYPGALNLYPFLGQPDGPSYQMALDEFAGNNIDASLEMLKGDISAGYVTSSALNLAGACMRLQGKNEEALPLLLMAYQLNPEQQFVAGNIFLVLKELSFGDLQKFENEMKNQGTLDTWSKNVLSGTIK